MSEQLKRGSAVRHKSTEAPLMIVLSVRNTSDTQIAMCRYTHPVTHELREREFKESELKVIDIDKAEGQFNFATGSLVSTWMTSNLLLVVKEVINEKVMCTRWDSETHTFQELQFYKHELYLRQ